MIRTWNGSSHKLLKSVLKEFNIETSALVLHKYEALSPDNFIWFFTIDKQRYCLYAQDYVPSLEHVLNVMNHHIPEWDSEDKYELVEAGTPVLWEESSPVIESSTYKPPQNTQEFMKYAVPSGYDFVFLARSVID